MEFLKRQWTSVQSDPKFMRRVNGWLTIFWIFMVPFSFVMGWLQSVTFVSALSLWALVSGHWAAWQAARVEVEQDREKKQDTEEKLIRRLVRETDVQRSRQAAQAKKRRSGKS